MITRRTFFAADNGPDSDVVQRMLVAPPQDDTEAVLLMIRLRGGAEFAIPMDEKWNEIMKGEMSIKEGEPIPLKLLEALREYQSAT